MAISAGLLFALIYVGLELRNGFPEGISFSGDAANTISVWHFPNIWFFAGLLFYCVFYTADTIRSGKVRERIVTIGITTVVASFLALFWMVPMLNWLYEDMTKPTAVSEAANVSKAPLTGDKPTTASSESGPVTVTYSKNGFSPVEVIVKKGDTVRFVAAEGVSLRLVSDYSAFNQKEAVSEYSFTFTEAGKYTYYDSPSKTSSLRKFISEFFGNRRVLQGTVNVTE